MTPRMRALRYGASIALVVVGAACGIVISGTLGGTLATVLVGLGLVGVVSLIFYEVGLTEDRDRAAGSGRPGSAKLEPEVTAEPGADPDAGPPDAESRPVTPAHPPGDPARLRPDRMRGQRRRLR